MCFRALCARALVVAACLPLSGGWSVFAVAAGAAVLAVPAAAQPVQAQASGQVVRIDAAAGKIAIRHGAIGKLGLPAMTLFYHLDPALLRGIAVGDSVTFTAERVDSQYRIIALEKK